MLVNQSAQKLASGLLQDFVSLLSNIASVALGCIRCLSRASRMLSSGAAASHPRLTINFFSDDNRWGTMGSKFVS